MLLRYEACMGSKPRVKYFIRFAKSRVGFLYIICLLVTLFIALKGIVVNSDKPLARMRTWCTCAPMVHCMVHCTMFYAHVLCNIAQVHMTIELVWSQTLLTRLCMQFFRCVSNITKIIGFHRPLGVKVIYAIHYGARL